MGRNTPKFLQPKESLGFQSVLAKYIYTTPVSVPAISAKIGWLYGQLDHWWGFYNGEMEY